VGILEIPPRCIHAVETARGLELLAGIGEQMRHKCFSITSNIDGHWARTAGIGEERAYEMHGALTHMQAQDGSGRIWPTDPAVMAALPVPQWDLAPGEHVEVLCKGTWQSDRSQAVGEDGAVIVKYDADGVGGPMDDVSGVRRPNGPDLCRVDGRASLPVDERGSPARPNVLMFGDGGFQADRIDEQDARYRRWLHALGKDTKLVVVEVGAGTAVPTVRMRCEELVKSHKGPATLVRINLDQSFVPAANTVPAHCAKYLPAPTQKIHWRGRNGRARSHS
jgi:NAD-dependent SIR2 family protein deacetylase